MQTTSIEWATHTSNPVVAVDQRTGRRGHFCTKVSRGCKHCYAERLNNKWGNQMPYAAQLEKFVRFDVNFAELTDLEKRRKPARIFIEDMSDLFHPLISQPIIEKVFATFLRVRPCVHLIVLTKRIERASNLLRDESFVSDIMDYIPVSDRHALKWPPEHIHVGCSIESQRTLHERGHHLIDLTLAGWTTFYSLEPHIEHVDFTKMRPGLMLANYLRDTRGTPLVHGVIHGGESGDGAVPLLPEMARFIRDQCTRFAIPYFFKQWGNWLPGTSNPPLDVVDPALWPHGGPPRDWPWSARDPRIMPCDRYTAFYAVGKHDAGNILDGRRHLHIPNRHCLAITQAQWLESLTTKPAAPTQPTLEGVA